MKDGGAGTVGWVFRLGYAVLILLCMSLPQFYINTSLDVVPGTVKGSADGRP